MKTYTPAELRTLADSRHTNPFFADQARAAMHYAANVLEAADAAVTAERQRAEQGGAKDAARYRWLKSRLLCADFNYGEPSEICYALVFEIPQDVRVSANLDATIDDAILASKPTAGEVGS